MPDTIKLLNGNIATVTTVAGSSGTYDVETVITTASGTVLQDSTQSASYNGTPDVGYAVSSTGLLAVVAGGNNTGTGQIFTDTGKLVDSVTYTNPGGIELAAGSDLTGTLAPGALPGEVAVGVVFGDPTTSSSSEGVIVNGSASTLLNYFNTSLGSGAGLSDYLQVEQTFNSSKVLTGTELPFSNSSGTAALILSPSVWNVTINASGGKTIVDLAAYDAKDDISLTYGYNQFLGQVGLQLTNENGDKTYYYYHPDYTLAFNVDTYFAKPVNGVSSIHVLNEDENSNSTVYTISTFEDASSNPIEIRTLNKDGSSSTETFASGKAYASQTISHDASGSETQLERDYASGTPQLITKYAGDGSYITNNYDTFGRVIETDTVAANGSKSVAKDAYASQTDTTPLSVEVDTISAAGIILKTVTSDNYSLPYQMQTAHVAGVTLSVSPTVGSDLYGANTGSDTFSFGSSFQGDTIYNFIATGANHDVIEISKTLAPDFSSIEAHIHNGEIDFGNGQYIILHGINTSTLTASDFHFV